MGRDAIKANDNVCFRCRKEAAKYNDKLSSREGAAELLGVSTSTLADYELGLTKVIPVDKVVLMADAYNAPELKAWYCTTQCPIGREFPGPSPDVSTIERTTIYHLNGVQIPSVTALMRPLSNSFYEGISSDVLDKAAARGTATSTSRTASPSSAETR